MSQKAQADEAWRTALDTLIQKFEIVDSVQAQLAAQERAQFQALMQDAVARIGSRLEIHATVTNSQAVAIGQNITQIINYYRQPDDTIDAAGLERYIRQYLAWVQDTYGKVTLRGLRRQRAPLVSTRPP